MSNPSTRPDLDAILLALAKDDERVFELLKACVGRILVKRHSDLIIATLRQHDVGVRHVVDWLKAAVINDDPWLHRLDDHGRVKKLMKFSTIEQVVKEADKAMLKAAQKSRNIKVHPGDEELVSILDDGFYIVRLLTANALDRESGVMQHCIGHGAYDEYLGRKGFELLSLRDASGRAHATLAVVNGTVQELQGKQNEPPKERYLKPVIQFLQASKLTLDIPTYILGGVCDTNGQFHKTDRIPEGVTLVGTVNLTRCKVSKLPDHLTVEKSLILTDDTLNQLPKGLKIGEDLVINRGSIANIPADIEVGRHVYLERTQISTLPARMKVGGEISMINMQLDKLPDGFTIDGSMVLKGSGLTSLPANMNVGGNLDLTDSKIELLPQGLSIGGNLDIGFSSIREIPCDIKIGKGLYMVGADIECLPSSLQRIDGDLYVTDSKLSSLGSIQYVGGVLDMARTAIKELPADLVVLAGIDICGTDVTHLPDSISDDVKVYCDEMGTTAKEFRIREEASFMNASSL